MWGKVCKISVEYRLGYLNVTHVSSKLLIYRYIREFIIGIVNELFLYKNWISSICNKLYLCGGCSQNLKLPCCFSGDIETHFSNKVCGRRSPQTLIITATSLDNDTFWNTASSRLLRKEGGENLTFARKDMELSEHILNSKQIRNFATFLLCCQ